MQSDSEYHNTSATPYRLGQIRLAALTIALRRACRQCPADNACVSQTEIARLKAAVREAELALELIGQGGEIEDHLE